MRGARCWFLGVVLLTIASLSLVQTPSAGQDADSKGEKVRFHTVDGVEIVGTYYPSARGKAPAVILLHALGDHSRTNAWTNLAVELQKKYSVLAFDFRGHGNSKNLSDATEFWKHPINKNNVKGAPKGTEIDYQNMRKEYFPALINDIAAARAYLEGRNDARDCNTSSMIVIGAESGATLGAIWLNSEWLRYQQLSGGFAPTQLNKTPEGKDVIAAIWLTPTTKLGSRTVSLSQILDLPARIGKTPMTFLYGDADASGKTIAKGCEKAIKGADAKGDYKYTAAVKIPDSKLAGANLLQKSTGTTKSIMEYLEDVVDFKGNAWAERDFRKSFYVWRMGNSLVNAKTAPTEKLLAFDTYEKFIPK
ncbi:MAG: hypothetical protein HY040_25440 [Planctomycetes bacterium]|nr:hypothetical protein [Planctomycetota bacterium]